MKKTSCVEYAEFTQYEVFETRTIDSAKYTNLTIKSYYKIHANTDLKKLK